MALTRHLLRLRKDRQKYDRLLTRALQLRGAEKEISDALIERVIIGLHDSFALAARNVILDSAIGKNVTRTGRKLMRTLSLVGFASPLDFLRHSWARNKKMPNSWEPDWFMPDNSIRAATLLQVSNEVEITNGLGALMSITRLRATRNVIAHCLPNTWQRFRDLNDQLGFVPMRLPPDLVMSYDPTTKNRYIDDWMTEIEDSIVIAIE
jgi:hypothetical protein